MFSDTCRGMQTFVSTIGYHETRVTRPILQQDLADEISVVLLRPVVDGDDSRGEEAIGYVRDMLAEVAPAATVTTEQIPTHELQTAVLSCSDVLLDAPEESELTVNFGGGARELFLPLTIATVMHAPLVDNAHQYTDVDQQVRALATPNLTAQIPTNAWKTLRVVNELHAETDSDGASISELADTTGQSESTVSRHVSQLADAAAVQTTQDGQIKRVQSTVTGTLLLRARQ